MWGDGAMSEVPGQFFDRGRRVEVDGFDDGRSATGAGTAKGLLGDAIEGDRILGIDGYGGEVGGAGKSGQVEGVFPALPSSEDDEEKGEGCGALEGRGPAAGVDFVAFKEGDDDGLGRFAGGGHGCADGGVEALGWLQDGRVGGSLWAKVLEEAVGAAAEGYVDRDEAFERGDQACGVVEGGADGGGLPTGGEQSLCGGEGRRHGAQAAVAHQWVFAGIGRGLGLRGHAVGSPVVRPQDRFKTFPGGGCPPPGSWLEV